MQLASCGFAAARARGRVPAAWSCQHPSLSSTTATLINKKNRAAAVACAMSRRDDDGDGSGRQVDEGMAVLRRRIHELRAAEGGWEPPPDDWAACEQESEWHATCDADVIVCGLVGALQALLMSERPAVVVAALVLTVPASAFILASHLLHASRGVLSGLPLPH